MSEQEPNGVAGPSELSQPPVAAFGPNGIEPKDEEVDQLAEEDELPDSDDEEYDPTDFRIHKPLPAYTEYTRQLGEVHRMIHDGLIELNPDYQRDVVWSAAKQSQLIESIFRNYTIPQVVLSVLTDESGEMMRNCVDGKQRLTSIQRFIDGLIPYIDPKTKTKFWYTTSDSQKGTRHLIPLKMREYFASRTITISEYDNITPMQEREVFQRVQLGVALKATEKLRAILSPRSAWISHLEEKHVSYDEGLASKINFDTKNARDFANIVTFIFVCHCLPTQIEPTNPKVEKWLSQDEDFTDEFKSDIEQVLRNLWVIASTPTYNAVFRTGTRVAPLEFVFISVFLYILRDEDDRKKQALAIHRLRLEIRRHHPNNVKLNTTIARHVWELMRQIQRDLDISTYQAIPTPKKKRRADDSDDSDFQPNRPQTAKKSKSRTKRT